MGSDSFGQRRLLGVTLLFGLGLAETVVTLARRPLLPVAVIGFSLVLWKQQLGFIYNSQMVAKRGRAITFDRLATAQAEVLYRQWLEAEGLLPSGLFVLGYDNLKGFWVDDDASREVASTSASHSTTCRSSSDGAGLPPSERATSPSAGRGVPWRRCGCPCAQRATSGWISGRVRSFRAGP